MDPFYAFLIFAVLLVLENLAAQSWAAPYFRLGIPVFFTRAALDGPLPEAQAAQALEAQFKGGPLNPTVRFKPLGEGQIALREALFEPRGGIRYLPVFHALARIEPQSAQVTLTGYINVWVLAALAYMIYRAQADPGFVPVALLILFILAFSYVLQASVARRVVLAAQELSGSR